MTDSQINAMKDNSSYQRVFKRYRVNLVALVQPDEGGDGKMPGKATAIVTSLSVSGLGFFCPVQFFPDKLIRVEIALGSQAYFLLALIKRCSPVQLHEKEVYRVGAQFARTEAVLTFIPDMIKHLAMQGVSVD